jgi:hypothetical protein
MPGGDVVRWIAADDDEDEGDAVADLLLLRRRRETRTRRVAVQRIGTTDNVENSLGSSQLVLVAEEKGLRRTGGSRRSFK